MTDKQSRLGRGLGDLLDDNSTSIRSQKPSVIIRTEESKVATQIKPSTNKSLYDTTPKPLFETKPRNKSLK
jgi:hypothetical protein